MLGNDDAGGFDLIVSVASRCEGGLVDTPAGRWVGLALIVAITLSSCSWLGVSPNPPAATAGPTTPAISTQSPSPTATPSKVTGRNDLKSGRTTRTVKSGRVRVALEYSLVEKVEDWTPGASQPLTVSLSAVGPNARQRIYLLRATAYLEVFDEKGLFYSPESLEDQANVSPGYLVTSPSTYTQVFGLPPLPEGATMLKIVFRYEILAHQTGSAPPDYAKLVANDTIVISRA